MENKLHALWMYIKHSRLLRILFFALLAIGVILYCLSHIPITKSMRYDMQGYIVSTDGEILEENLKRMGLDDRWLQKQLNAQGYRNAREVFLALCDENKQLTVFPIEQAGA